MGSGCSDLSPQVQLWEPWTVPDALTRRRLVGGARTGRGHRDHVFVAVIAALFNVSGIELVLHTDLDSNRELRDAGIVNVVSGAFGGIPGYHALSLSALARQMGVNARAAGLVAALVPLAAVVFGAAVIEIIPRVIVGGVLVFVGLGVHRRVGVGQAPHTAEGRVRHRARDPRDGRDPGSAARRRGRPRAGGRAVRRELRPGRAGQRGGVRRDVPQQRRPSARRARGAAIARRARADPAPARLRLLRNRERTARAHPQARGAGGAAVPARRPAARGGHGFLGGGCPSARSRSSRGARRRARVHRRPGAGTAPARGAAASSRSTASCGSSPTSTAACSGARTVCSRAPRPVGGEARRRARRSPAAPVGLLRARAARRGNHAHPPGRPARRRVRAGIGPPARRADDPRRHAACA